MKCFLSDSTENLSKIDVDGEEYYFDEEKFSDLSMKALKDKIRAKKDESSKKTSVLADAIKMEAAKYGISIEELVFQITGKRPEAEKLPAAKQVQQPIAKQTPVEGEDGFTPVTGELVSSLRVNVKAEDGVSGMAPAHSTPTINGKRIEETDKKVKREGNMITTRGSFGETRIVINQVDAKKFNEEMLAVDDYDLRRSHKTSKDCTMCRGSGITMGKVCPKCNGSGKIF